MREIADSVVRFATLTLTATDEPLAAQIRHLLDSFRRLRQRDAWKKHVRGGCATLEITCNETTGRWHPHLHLLLLGNYWAQQALSAEWSQASQGSYVVDIRLARSERDVARYVAKYISKPADSTVYTVADRLEEMIEALRGTKTLITFGCARRWKLLQEPGKEDWVTLGHWRELALGGNEKAERHADVVAAIRSNPGRATRGEWTIGDLTGETGPPGEHLEALT